MREQGKTSVHLLLAIIVTMFGTILILTILAMSWEPWMIPVILIGNTLIWCIHIGRTGSETFYENLCAGLLMVGFFFFGVHKVTLFDIPGVACMLILIFSMFNKKRLLYMTAALYILELLYHCFLLKTLTPDMGAENIIRVALGVIVVSGSIAIAWYRIIRRRESWKRYDSTLAELETAGQQNAEFLSNVSHELRTPINMVLGISEVILEKDIPPEIRTDMLSIQMAGKRLSNQINNMLDYTEIVEGTLVPAKEPYMITSVLNDIITMTAMQNSKHQLEMVFDLDPKTPSVLIGDSEKISHVLKILLDNSIKFTEEGGINVSIACRQEDYGVNLAIDISDTGIGMTDSQLLQIWNDFYQADSGSNRLAGGLGLGLPIARGLLHAMGGFIYFDNKENQGLQAHITIPQGVEDPTPALVIPHPERLCIACYFRPEKYNSEEVQRYYDYMILHMVEGLGIEGYQAHNFDGLLKLRNSHPLTHVFIAQTEYEENLSYYEELSQTLQVVVIAERDYAISSNSRILVIHKPFFALSVVNLLNGEAGANGFGEAQAVGRRPFTCEGVRVLAVDDEEMNLVVAKGVLGSYGIQVDTCLSGREALDRCACISYDIVFLDHMMPGFDGVETLKRIREINNGMYKDLPVIALTANTLSGAREMFRNEGFTEFIPKPIERAILERVLRKILPERCIHYDLPFGQEPPKESVSESAPSQEKDFQPAPPQEFHCQDTLPEEDASLLITLENLERQDTQEAGEIPLPPKQEENGVPLPLAQEENGAPLPLVQEENSVPLPLAQEENGAPLPLVQEENSAPLPLIREENDVPLPPEQEKKAGQQFPSEWDTWEEQAPAGKPASSLAPLSRIGINVQLGLEYCCGEEDFYLEMLRMFCSQAVEKRAEIVSLYQEENWNDYAVKVHALKSTALTIGAEQLAEQAKLLEQAGKKENIGYIRHDHPTLLRLYDQVCTTIEEVLMTNETGGISGC